MLSAVSYATHYEPYAPVNRLQVNLLITFTIMPAQLFTASGLVIFIPVVNDCVALAVDLRFGPGKALCIDPAFW
jgi:hypothetical protein